MNDSAAVITIGLLILAVFILAWELHNTNKALSEAVDLCGLIIDRMEIHKEVITGMMRLSPIAEAIGELAKQGKDKEKQQNGM